jgi:hypothetical protein
VTIENRASRQGVVRAMALSDHCRCVSTPRWARASWKVTSTVQLRYAPPHDLRGLAHRFGAEQGLRCKAALGIAHQHPSDRHDRQTAVPPHGCPGGDLKGALARPVPAGHHDRVAARVLGREDRGERRQSSALGPRASDRARRPWRGRLVESSIQPKAGDRRDAGAAHRVEEQQGREAAVAHHHEVAPRQPAPRLEGELTPDVEQRLVPTAAFATGALGRHQRGQERQRPDAPRPGDRGEHHQAHPAQPARLDEVAVGGANRITVDALGRDPLAAAALDRIVQSQDHGAALRERMDEEPEQDAAADARAPRSAVEDAVDVHKPPLPRGP